MKTANSLSVTLSPADRLYTAFLLSTPETNPAAECNDFQAAANRLSALDDRVLPRTAYDFLLTQGLDEDQVSEIFAESEMV